MSKVSKNINIYTKFSNNYYDTKPTDYITGRIFNQSIMNSNEKYTNYKQIVPKVKDPISV